MRKSKLLSALMASALCSVLLTGCGGGGGGGGGDNFIGAANLRVKASPKKIDTGDRTQITIEVSEVNEAGILLKVKFPKGLSYVLSSAFLNVDSNEIDIGPDKNLTKDNDTYLVFFLTKADFGSEAQGSVTFQLVGNSVVSEGQIEVDADVNDPLVDDNTEFNVDTPEFGAEDSTDIEVTN